MFAITLTPNRSTQKMFARLISYNRRGDKVERVFISFNRKGKPERTKTPSTRAYALKDAEVSHTMRDGRSFPDAYLEGMEPDGWQSLEERSVMVAPTAKRDWLIRMGAICPNPHGHAPWNVVWNNGEEPFVDRASEDYLNRKPLAR